MNKKGVKISLFILGSILFIVIAFIVYYNVVTYGVELDKHKLINLNSSIEFLDSCDNTIEAWSDDKNIINADDIPEYTLNAFVAIEDKRFYSHNGVDVKGVLRAFINNIKSFSFKEGASTITQQLIKNTHLSGEKTLKRKLSEIKLARQLEKDYSKREILEMYVNTIYFGDGCYGITSAANNYFGITPSKLSINQSAALAGIIKAPAIYSPKISPELCNERKNVVLKEMYEQNFIEKNEFDKFKNEAIVTQSIDKKTRSPYLDLVKNELDGILDKSAFSNAKIKVYTYYENNTQKSIENSISYEIKSDIKVISLNDKNKIQAFYSTVGDTPRRLGSTLKPLAVFGPAIDMGIIDSCTPILDEKININGYSPSNYKNRYYGYVSAKFALAKSLNSCAVKILNDCGVENCLKYIKKTDIKITEKDNSLRLALGTTESGATLTQLAGAYGNFLNNGVYVKPTSIRKITYNNGKILYLDHTNEIKVFGEDTTYIINDMLKSTVKDGTAKTLSTLNIPIAAKTGTVGNENGNTDAYCVSYSGDKIVAVWLGNDDSSYMTNAVSGGTLPTKIAYGIWKNMLNTGYKGKVFHSTDKVIQISLDKISYEQNHIIEKADDYFPSRYVLNEYFKKERVPKAVSKRFSTPKIENANISVNNNKIVIRLCLPEHCEYKIYRSADDMKIQIYDSYGKTDKEIFTDNFVMENTTYVYSVLPYFKGKFGIVFGNEYRFNEIKTPPKGTIGDEWWKEIVT